jgi:predicted RNA polymerase sigma factor
LPSVRGDLLAKVGRFDEARAECERAAALTGNARERDLLLERAAACARAAAAAAAKGRAEGLREPRYGAACRRCFTHRR